LKCLKKYIEKPAYETLLQIPNISVILINHTRTGHDHYGKLKEINTENTMIVIRIAVRIQHPVQQQQVVVQIVQVQKLIEIVILRKYMSLLVHYHH
jgi:hypothetical protein